jgi:hypothetical protein
MTTRWNLLVLALAGTLCCGAVAGDDEKLARSWWPDAMLGNAEKQERLAELFLGSHGGQAKGRPYEGIHFLFRAAVHGRPVAMQRLGEALKKGRCGAVLVECAGKFRRTPRLRQPDRIRRF